MNVILQSFLIVYLVQYERFIPFTVPDRSPFLTVTMTVPDRFWEFQKRSGTVRNGHGNGQERWAVRNGERPGMVNGQECLGTFESWQSNALGRIVGNVHGAFTVRSRSRFNIKMKLGFIVWLHVILCNYIYLRVITSFIWILKFSVLRHFFTILHQFTRKKFKQIYCSKLLTKLMIFELNF
jgi:hypothetical protein